MAEYILANGRVLTDEDIELECAEYESGAWEGRLENIRVGRPATKEEPLVSVVVKMPASMVAAVDAASVNRSDFIRHAVAAALQAVSDKLC